jgi:hypothetical protein
MYVIAIWYTLTGLASLSNILNAATPAPGSKGHVRLELFQLITAALVAIAYASEGCRFFYKKGLHLERFAAQWQVVDSGAQADRLRRLIAVE